MTIHLVDGRTIDKRNNILAFSLLVFILTIFALLTANGFAFGGQTCLTVKYDPEGNLQWAAQYLSDCFSPSLVTNDAGQVYVVQQSTLIKYDNDGSESWVATYPNESYLTSIVANGPQYFLVAGSQTPPTVPGNRMDVARYDENGDPVWTANATVDSGWAVDLALGPTGAVAVAGVTTGLDSFVDCLVVQFSADGTEDWRATYHVDGLDCLAEAVTIDADSNVIVTGGAETSHRAVTVKYDQDGNQLWAVEDMGAYALDVTTDSERNVLVTGAKDGGYYTLKYDSSGNSLWSATWFGPGGYLADHAVALALDSAENVIVSGLAYDGENDVADIATVKYDGDGNELWVANLANSRDHDSAGVAVDSSDNVVIAGTELEEVIPPNHYVVVKYDPDGNETWTNRYDDPGFYRRGLTALALDENGAVYVTGEADLAPDDDTAPPVDDDADDDTVTDDDNTPDDDTASDDDTAPDDDLIVDDDNTSDDDSTGCGC